MQQLFVYIALGAAIVFIVRKYVFPPKKKNNCDTDCEC